VDLETKWNQVEARVRALPWWAKTLWAGFGTISVLTGITVTGVMKAALDYEIPDWVPGFVDSGAAALVLTAIGLFVIALLLLSRRPHPEVPQHANKTDSPAGPSTHEIVEVDEDRTPLFDLSRFGSGPICQASETMQMKKRRGRIRMARKPTRRATPIVT
jgi:hypothetical protein